MQGVIERGREAEIPRPFYAIPQLAPLVRGSSVTAHCHAATAQLTRAYQSDHRRQNLTSITPCATLDKVLPYQNGGGRGGPALGPTRVRRRFDGPGNGPAR